MLADRSLVLLTAPSERRLVVLLSSERSGSTLTRVMLGEHSRMVAPQEMFLMRYSDYRAFRNDVPVAIESLVEFFELIGQPRDAGAIDTACSGMSTLDVYRWLLRSIPRGSYLVDKTPAYTNDGTTLRRSLALEPFYIWLIRHPLGVIESYLRMLFRQRYTMTPAGLGHRIRDYLVDQLTKSVHELPPAARQREVKWVIQQTIVREFLATVPADQKCVVQFEDLVRNPEALVKRMCAAIGVAFEPKMLDACRIPKVINARLGDPDFSKRDRIDATMADAWRRYFTEDRLARATHKLMDAIGVVRDQA